MEEKVKSSINRSNLSLFIAIIAILWTVGSGIYGYTKDAAKEREYLEIFVAPKLFNHPITIQSTTSEEFPGMVAISYCCRIVNTSTAPVSVRNIKIEEISSLFPPTYPIGLYRLYDVEGKNEIFLQESLAPGEPYYFSLKLGLLLNTDVYESFIDLGEGSTWFAVSDRMVAHGTDFLGNKVRSIYPGYVEWRSSLDTTQINEAIFKITIETDKSTTFNETFSYPSLNYHHSKAPQWINLFDTFEEEH